MAKASLFGTLLRKTAWTWFNLTHRQDLLNLLFYQMKRQIIRYHTKHPSEYDGAEEAMEFLKNHAPHPIPYPFILEYPRQNIRVYRDGQTGLPYVLHENKRLFFKRSESNKTVQRMYWNLFIEQDPRSPHCYTDPSFGIEPGDTLLDIGCAEGNFALSSVEKAKHLVLFEGDPEWIEALEATFAPWREKVTIVPKWVSDIDSEESVEIDSFLRDFGQVDAPFMKIDIEGMERKVLQGMRQLLEGGRPMKMALCTYHLPGDYEDFTALLPNYNFSLTASRGVLLRQGTTPPYFRKCLLRATR